MQKINLCSIKKCIYYIFLLKGNLQQKNDLYFTLYFTNELKRQFYIQFDIEICIIICDKITVNYVPKNTIIFIKYYIYWIVYLAIIGTHYETKFFKYEYREGTIVLTSLALRSALILREDGINSARNPLAGS